MTNKNKKVIYNVVIIIGAVFLVAAAGLLFFNMRGLDIDTAKALASIDELMPNISDSVPQEKGNNVMPSMEIDGESYVAVLEMSTHKYRVPVRSVWDEKAVKAVPCRYSGSVYNNSLIIALSDEEGQMDFVNNVNAGDKLTITDMRGERFSYQVTKIENRNEIDKEKLNSGEYDLTLLVEYSGYTDYLYIRCDNIFMGSVQP